MNPFHLAIFLTTTCLGLWLFVLDYWWTQDTPDQLP